MGLSLVNFTSSMTEEWEASILKSDYSWFWHSRKYLDFLQEINVSNFFEDRSFMILEKNIIAAICPLFISKMSDGRLGFCCGDVNIEFPAILNGFSDKKIRKILDFYFMSLESMSLELGVETLEIRVSPQSKKHSQAQKVQSSYLPRYGIMELAKHTQMIDLEKPENLLWAEVRKGHKSSIKKAEKLNLKINIFNKSNITQQVFDSYSYVHSIDAGDSIRSAKSFDIMYNWIITNEAILLQATHDGDAVAYILIITRGEGSYYGSSCRLPNFNQCEPVHARIWNSIIHLKQSGFKYYDVGHQFFGPQFGYTPTEKEIQISNFKRGFGGYLMPIYSGKRIYTDTLFVEKKIIE